MEQDKETKTGDLEIMPSTYKKIRTIDPRNIFVEEGYNTRLDFDLPELIDSIRENGVKQPITCWKVAEKEKYYIIDGERRWKACMILLDTEQRLVMMDAICINKPSNEDRTLLLITKNDGKKLTPLELGETFKRLKDYGWTVEQIATKAGKAKVQVYNGLKMANFPQEVKNDIIAGKLSANTVLEESKKLKDPDDIVKVVKSAKEKEAKLDKVPSGGGGSCKLKTGKEKKSKIELAAASVEDEILKEGVKKLLVFKVACCQTCCHPAKTVDVPEGGELRTRILCNLVTLKAVPYDKDELEVTKEYEGEKLPVDCPLKKFKINSELVS